MRAAPRIVGLEVMMILRFQNVRVLASAKLTASPSVPADSS
jgi:hypothetical protein